MISTMGGPHKKNISKNVGRLVAQRLFHGLCVPKVYNSCTMHCMYRRCTAAVPWTVCTAGVQQQTINKK